MNWPAASTGTGGRRLKEAERVARSLTTDPKRQARALAEVARALTRSGQPERAAEIVAEAEQVARSLPDRGCEAKALYAVASARSLEVTALRATRSASAAISAVRLSCPTPASAWALAGTKQFMEAEEVARSIDDPNRQADALAAVAKALARARRLVVAERVTRNVADPNRRADALAAVAKALAGAGQLEQAEWVARSITDPNRKAKALVATAVGLIEAAESDESLVHADRAARLIAVVLTETAWWEGIRTLPALAPDAVGAIREAL